MLLSVIVSPYWSGITDAFYKEDYAWIRRSIRNLNRIAIGFCAVLIILLQYSRYYAAYPKLLGRIIRKAHQLSGIYKKRVERTLRERATITGHTILVAFEKSNH